jgi:hypothetical protein
MKLYHDRKSYVKPIDIQVGDNVIVHDTRLKRSVPPYDPRIMQVQRRHGSLVTAGSGDRRTTRNVSMFKKVHSECTPHISQQEEEEEDSSVQNPEPTVLAQPPSAVLAQPPNPVPVQPQNANPTPVTRSPRATTEHSNVRPTRARKAPGRFRDYVMQ